MRAFIALIALCFVSCTEEEMVDVPSCQQAIAAFYNVGCYFVDSETGEQIPPVEMAGACQMMRGEAPTYCQDELDDWMICLADSPPNCDCSIEQEAILRCL